MFVKSDPEHSGSDLTKGVMVDEEYLISQLFFQFSLSCLSCQKKFKYQWSFFLFFVYFACFVVNSFLVAAMLLQVIYG